MAMDETAGRLETLREYLVVSRADIGHLGCVNRSVMQRRAPVWAALHDVELRGLLRHFRDELYRCCAGADDGYAFAAKLYWLTWPMIGVKRWAAELVDAIELRHHWRRQHADGSDENAASEIFPAL